ncbi:MAG: methyltransferase domain-containing protein [Fimbriimonadaceae bacterium]|nr:methyltransferase domain-containing protein [Chitinophagales bacterium]
MGTKKELQQEVVNYYQDTGLDYREWSPSFNMHFGYYKFLMNPFHREPMLEEMNHLVFKHLHISEKENVILDLGCGLAAPCRTFAKKYPDKKITGITIVPWQIEQANLLNIAADLQNNIQLILGDYTDLPFEDNSADRVYALESCCHSEGRDKAAFIKEMMRVLKPGQRFVIVDGFIKKEPQEFGPLVRYCYNQIIKGWALPSFPHLYLFKKKLLEEGAEEIQIKDLSYRVAPSVLHAPFVVLYFFLKKLLQGEKLNSVRLGHLKACWLGLILGMHRRKFSYCLVTGIKKK